MGRYRSGQTGQTVNLLAYAFIGSNPILPTTSPWSSRATWRVWRWSPLTNVGLVAVGGSTVGGGIFSLDVNLGGIAEDDARFSAIPNDTTRKTNSFSLILLLRRPLEFLANL